MDWILPSIRMLITEVVPAPNGAVIVHYDLLIQNQTTTMSKEQWEAYQANDIAMS